MQKERPASVKVLRRTATERAPSLPTAAYIACMMAHILTVRLRPRVAQSGQPRLQGVQSVRDPRCHSHGSSWLAARSSRHGRARASSRTVWAAVPVG